MNQILNDLHAIIDIPKDPTRPLRLHHPSFRDFLLDTKRCEDLSFGIIETQAHGNLATKCRQLMLDSLKQDIIGLNQPGALATDVQPSGIEQFLPLELQYACLYWIEHVRRSNTQPCDNGQEHTFLQEHLLHWLEALGWMKRMSEGVLAISSLEAQLSVTLLCYLKES
jgi:hypothetical protein